MLLTKLILEQFRNHQRLEVDFSPRDKITYIVGPNAQGKTNILESIYLLALTKSFRTPNHEDMIGWNHEYARVQGFFDYEHSNLHTDQAISLAATSQTPLHLEVFLGKPPQPLKVFKKNGVKSPAANFLGHCQVVFFHPEDLNMLYLGPDLRRAYLNVMNVQVNQKYFLALRTYQKVLKQRNALLNAIKEARASEQDLSVWDDQLIENGSIIMFERAKTVAYFQQHIDSAYRKISAGKENIQISYRHTLPDISNQFPGLPFDNKLLTELPLWQESFTQVIKKNRQRDMKASVTTHGPHRDDLEFNFHELELSAHASRGEYRSLLLALKIIELQFFEEKTGQKPILLLDDVFSELDPSRQGLLLDSIQEHQSIITTTHRDHHAGGTLKGQYLEINNGTVLVMS